MILERDHAADDGGLAISARIAGVVALALVLYVTTYRVTFGERDAYRVFTGVLDAFQNGKPLSSDLVYGYGISRGYFAVVEWLRPWAGRPHLIALALNLVTTLSLIGAVVALDSICRRLGSAWSGTFGVAALMSVPIWFHGAQYAHPMWPAMALFLGAAAIQMRAWDAGSKPWMTPLAILLLAAAFSFRLDVVLMSPLYLGLAVQSGRVVPSRIVRLLAFGAVALALALLPFVLFPAAARPEGSPLDQLLSWHSPTRFVRFFVFSQLRIGRAIGPALIGAYLVSVAVLLSRRDYVTLLLTAPAILLNYLFWIPNPQPERHFLYLVPPLAISVGVALSLVLEQTSKSRRDRAAATVAGLTIIGLLVYALKPWAGFVYLAGLPLFALLLFGWLETVWPRRAQVATAVVCVAIGGAIVASPRQLLFTNYFSARDPVILSSLSQKLLDLPVQDRRVLVIADSYPLLATMMEESKTPLRFGFDGPWIKVENAGQPIWLYPQGWVLADALAAVEAAAARQPVLVVIDPVAAPDAGSRVRTIPQAEVLVGP